MAINDNGVQVERQYIGARYVPKFFQGVNGSPEWVAGLQYEPLTIVTYLGNSFTSKIPVPMEVGDPADNPTYWVNTGNFNAQLQDVTNKINSAIGEIAQIKDKALNVKDFGALGDGVTNESAIFTKIFNDKNNNIIYIPSGKYVLTGIGRVTFNGTIISDSAELVLGDGDQLQHSTELSITGIIFNVTGTNTMDVISPVTGTFSDFISIKNCIFINTSATATASYRVAIRCSAKTSVVKDVYIEGFDTGVIWNKSNVTVNQKSITWSNIKLVNVHLGVDVEGITPPNDYSINIKNVAIENIFHVNTAQLQETVGYKYGYSTVLVGGVNGCTISNIVSIRPLERAIYLSGCENVAISNVLSKFSQCIKIAGLQQNGENITMSSHVTVSNVKSYDVRSNGFLLSLYQAKNITCSNFNCYNEKPNTSDVSPLIQISQNVENVVLDGFTMINMARGAVMFLTDTGYVNKWSNIILRSFLIDNPSPVVSYDCIRVTDTREDKSNILINQLSVIDFVVDPYIDGSSNDYSRFITLTSAQNVSIDRCTIGGGYTPPSVTADASVSNLIVNNTEIFTTSPLAMGTKIGDVFGAPLRYFSQEIASKFYYAGYQNQTSGYGFTMLKITAGTYSEVIVPEVSNLTMLIIGPKFGAYHLNNRVPTTLLGGDGLTWNNGTLTSDTSGNYFIIVVQ